MLPTWPGARARAEMDEAEMFQGFADRALHKQVRLVDFVESAVSTRELLGIHIKEPASIASNRFRVQRGPGSCPE